MSRINGKTADYAFLDEFTTIDLSQVTTMDFSPSVGQVYLDTTNMTTNVYSGSQWVSITPQPVVDELDISTIMSDWDGKDFEDRMPDMYKIKEMCDMYPGFKKAFDHLRTIYNLIQDDYQERQRDF